jgi:hypothetical protein
MKKLYSALIMASLMLAVLPMVMAVSVGTGTTPTIPVEQFAPRVWMCDHRIVYDDNTEPGRVFPEGDHQLVERINNYAFEGEKIQWTVLVMDKNKIDQNIDVYATIGDSQGAGNDIEVNCVRVGGCNDELLATCNAQIDEEKFTRCSQLTVGNGTGSEQIADFFQCTLTVETPESMYGQYWITVEAQDGEGNTGTMAENEYWFLNPVIALSIDGDMAFASDDGHDGVRPGTTAYSSTMLVGNDADDSSGVMMDMFISGTDFYDSSSSGARCPTTNQLSLSNFRYFVTNGAYNSKMDMDIGRTGDGARTTDSEGYTNIGYGIGFNNPHPFYDGYEILQAQKVGPYYTANLLAPGAEMALTFKLSLPEPCTGNFDTGSVYFWGEAI